MLQVPAEIAYLPLRDFAQHAVTRLDQPDQVLEVAVRALQIVVGDARPAAADIALDLVPGACDEISVHVRSPMAARRIAPPGPRVMRTPCQTRTWRYTTTCARPTRFPAVRWKRAGNDRGKKLHCGGGGPDFACCPRATAMRGTRRRARTV